jgi:hypothetical protein
VKPISGIQNTDMCIFCIFAKICTPQCHHFADSDDSDSNIMIVVFMTTPARAIWAYKDTVTVTVVTTIALAT